MLFIVATTFCDTIESIKSKNKENVYEGEKSEQIINYNQEVIEKVFNMMEKMTERIVQMENIIWMIMKMEND